MVLMGALMANIITVKISEIPCDIEI